MIRRNGGGEEEARGTIWIVISKERAKKRTTALQTMKTSTLNYCNPLVCTAKKKQARNEPKESSRKATARQKKKQTAE